MTALSSLRQIIHVETLADLTAELGCAPGYMAWVDGYGRYTAIPVDTYSVDNLHVVEGYAADNIQWADESIIGAGGFTNIIHEPCLYLATRSIDVTSPDGYGIDCDTIYSLSDGNRILLTKQSSARENGPWVWKGIDLPLERPEDWAGGSIITVDTIHQFTVLYGTLWGGTTTWFGYFGASDILIWGPGMSSGQSVNWFHVGGATDVFDDVVSASGSTYTFYDAGISGDEGFDTAVSFEVVGTVAYDADSYKAYMESTGLGWDVYAYIPFETDVYTDDSGGSWSAVDLATGAVSHSVSLKRSSTSPKQGTYYWAFLVFGDIYANGQGFMYRSLPAGYNYRIRGWYKTSNSAVGQVAIGGYSSVGKTVTSLPNTSGVWTSFDGTFTIATGEVNNRYLQFAVAASISGSINFDGVQIDRQGIFVAPDPRIEIDTAKSAEMSRWTNGYDPNMLTVNVADGLLIAPACNWDRHYKLRITANKYNRLAVPVLSITPPADDVSWAYA